MSETKKVGRKKLWDKMKMKDKLGMVKGFALQGLQDKEICELLRIDDNTFYKWKNEHQDFAEALDNNRHKAVAELVESGFKSAKGYFVEEVTTTHDADGFSKTVKKKYITPDNRMNRFLLQNWDAEQFKDSKTIKHEVNKLEDYFTDETLFEDDNEESEEIDETSDK